MSGTGIIIELEAGKIKNANLGMITMAGSSGGRLTALVASRVDETMKTTLESHGVNRIVEVILPDGCDTNPDVTARALQGAIDHFELSAVFGLSTALGKDLLPRIAAAMDAPLVMDCIAVDLSRKTVKTTQYSGKTIGSIRMTGEPVLVGIRPNAADPAENPASAEVITFDARQTGVKKLTVLHTREPDKSKAVSLVEAEVIIAGGRGMKNGENFDILRQCARKLNAAVAASRVAVDSGWVPYAMQVGQTGEKVSPKVYIACGISGSIQHFAGMKMSGMVIALNTDKHAAIMANCDYYAVADALEIVPWITRLLEND